MYAHPEDYYDQIYRIDLSELEPYVNGPFTPDAARPVSVLREQAEVGHYPARIELY